MYQMHQLRGVCQVFMEKVKNLKDGNCLVTPTVITRSVGLQVAVDSSPVGSVICEYSLT